MATDVKQIEWLLTAVDRASPVFRGIESSMDRLKMSWGSLTALFGAGAIGGTMISLVKSAIDAGDELNKLSQKIGVTVSDLSELKFAAQLSDVETTSFTRGMKGLSDVLVQAQDATSKQASLMKALGVDIKGGPTEALKTIADAFTKLEDGEVKTTLAGVIFGAKMGIDLIPLLNQGRRGIDAASESARKLGLTLSEDFAKQSEQFNDNMKKLTTGGQKFGIMVANEILPGMTTLTDNLAKQAENGEKFLGTLKEIGKAYLAFAGATVGGPFDAAATAAFAEDGKRPGIQAIRRADGSTPAPTAPNKEEVACVLSGGKWIGGKCVRAVTGDNSQQHYLDEMEKLRMEGAARSADAQIAEADELARILADIKKKEFAEEEAARAESIKAMLKQIDDAQDEEIRQAADYLHALEAQAKKTDSFMRDLGFTMTSAFEAAVAGGQNLRSVMQSLGNDIAKILTRKFISDPLGDAVSGMLKDAFSGWGSGGNAAGGSQYQATSLDWIPARASGGPVMGGTTYLVGEDGPELFTPPGNGTIVPNGDLQGGGSMNVTINVGSLDPRTAASVIMSNMPLIVQGINTAYNRRGQYGPLGR